METRCGCCHYCRLNETPDAYVDPYSAQSTCIEMSAESQTKKDETMESELEQTPTEPNVCESLDDSNRNSNCYHNN